MPYEFLAFCGVVGLGRLPAEGDGATLPVLRQCASDPRWRIREALAIALQRLGEVDMDRLIREMREWVLGGCWVRRWSNAPPPRPCASPSSLRKGLGYCWSVAVVALPGEGKPPLEKWFAEPERAVRWIMRENLKKNRLVRMDAAWVDEWRAAMGGGNLRPRPPGGPAGDT